MAIGSEGLRPSDLDAMDDIRLAQELEKAKAEPVSYTHLTLPTTPYV